MISSMSSNGTTDRRPATGAAAAFPGGDTVALFRDHRLDTPTAQLPADHTAGIPTISQHRIRASPCPSRPQARNVDLFQHGLKHRPVVALAAGDHQRQGTAVPVDGGMDLA